MFYTIYKDNKKVGTTKERTFTVKELTPNTPYTFGVSLTVDGKESKQNKIKVRTLPDRVDNITYTSNVYVGALLRGRRHITLGGY